MSLPKEITTESIREVSDQLRSGVDNSIDDAMSEYFEELVDHIAQKCGLTEEQAEELEDRLCWVLELLPETPPQ